MAEVTITTPEKVGMVTLRGASDVLAPVLKKRISLDIPNVRQLASGSARAVLWMSPDELLLICGYDEAPKLAEGLQADLADAHATVAVVSDARVVFDLGAGAERLLRQLAPVDLSAMAATEVRRTRLAQVPAAFWRQGDGWRLVCFRSHAGYVANLLANAAA